MLLSSQLNLSDPNPWPMPTLNLGGYIVAHRYQKLAQFQVQCLAQFQVQKHSASKGMSECPISHGEFTHEARAS
jgi:hypothetical protein